MYTNTARDIVNELLESEDPDFDADEYMAIEPDPIDLVLQKMGYARSCMQFWEKAFAEPWTRQRYIIVFSLLIESGVESPDKVRVAIDSYVPVAGWMPLWSAVVLKSLVSQVAPALESGAKTAISMDMDGIDFKRAMNALLNTFQ